jgi:hypothetical protein
MKKWFKDEEFWRDITKSVLSGVILAVLLYAFAVFLGLVKAPDTRGQVLFAALVLPYLVISGSDVYTNWKRERRDNARQLMFVGGAISYWLIPPVILYLMLFHRDIL